MNDRNNSMLRRMDILELQLHRLDVIRTRVLEKWAGYERRLDAITSPETLSRNPSSDTMATPERRKSWPNMLVVSINGKTIDHRIAARTFVETLRTVGLDRVRTLGLRVRAVPLVSRQQHDGYEQWPVEGWLVVTHSATEEKKEILDEISRRLALDMRVEIVPRPKIR